MIRNSLMISLIMLSLTAFAQDPVKRTTTVYAIPAETVKKTTSANEARVLPQNSNASIYSAEIDKNKKQVTITPMPATAPPPKNVAEPNAEKK